MENFDLAYIKLMIKFENKLSKPSITILVYSVNSEFLNLYKAIYNVNETGDISTILQSS
jgi:hypothetical protein